MLLEHTARIGDERDVHVVEEEGLGARGDWRRGAGALRAARRAPRSASPARATSGTARGRRARGRRSRTAPRGSRRDSCAAAAGASRGPATPAGRADSPVGCACGMTLPASWRPQLSSWHWLHARLSWPWRRSQVARPASRNGCVRGSIAIVDRQAARLARDVGGQRQQLAALPGEGRGLLPVGAAHVDALLESDRPSLGGVERRMARGHALHARPGIAVAVGAGAAGGAGLPAPQRRPLEHPEQAGIGGVVVLHRARLAAHEVVAGAAVGGRSLAGEGRRRQRDHPQRGPESQHLGARRRNPARAMRRVQLRGGARWPHARRTLCTLSVRSRAPTTQMGPYHRSTRRRWRPTPSPRSRCRRSSGTRWCRSRWRPSRRRRRDSR